MEAADQRKMSIKENDHVILKKENNMRVFQVRRGRDVWLDKCKFTLNGIIDHPYGTTFEVKNGQMVKCSKEVKVDVQTDMEQPTKEKGKDNRNLLDQDSNQKLSRDEIEQLKKEGVTGDKLIERLVENSATFQNKTEYSQAKYVKKKKKKHLLEFTVLKPTTRLLCSMHWSKGAGKICNLRLDSLAQMLTQGNVRAGSTVAVVDSCMGLVTGAAVERLGGIGKVVWFYNGSMPPKTTLEAYDFPQEVLDTIYYFPINQVNTLKLYQKQKSINVTAAPTDLPSCVKDTVSDSIEISNDSAELAHNTVADANSAEKSNLAADTDLQDQAADTDLQDQAADTDLQDQAADTDLQDQAADTDLQDQAADTSSAKECVDISFGGKSKKRPALEDRLAAKQAREKEIETARNVILEGGIDCLMVATKFHPTPIVTSLLDFTAPSRQLIVYSQFKEALMDCYVYLREHGGLVNYRMTETWQREYQVLPNRTHPVIQMSGTGGYLLTATTVVKETN